MKNVYIANDHAAVDLKNELCDYIESLGFHVVNLGTDEKTSVNYPEYAEKTAKARACRPRLARRVDLRHRHRHVACRQ